MVAVTICSDFEAQQNKVCYCLHCFPIYLTWSDRTGCHDLSFLNVEFSLSSFPFIKRLFSSSSLSAIRVVSSPYLSLSWPKLLFIACCQSVLMNRKDNKIRALWTSHEQPVQVPSAHMHVPCWLLAVILRRYYPSDILSRTTRPLNKSLLEIPSMTSFHCYWLLKWDYHDDFREIKQDFTRFYTW